MKSQQIDYLNSLLSYHQQLIYIISGDANNITLSNGTTITGNDRNKFVRRITNSKTTEWVRNIDKLLSGQITEKEIKSELAKIGGISCQQKHGADIQLNLNTGIPWNVGTKGKNIGTLGPRSQAVKDKISAKNSGRQNGMFGVKMSEADKEFRSTLMKQKILDGKFTPNSNNRNTHWNAAFAGKRYRSSWEALYHYINPNAEYETLRIEYILNNVSKVYIVDFVDHITKQVIEVKPVELCAGEKFNAKLLALIAWAAQYEYKVVIATKEWLQDNMMTVDYNQFDSATALKIKGMYETRKTNRNN